MMSTLSTYDAEALWELARMRQAELLAAAQRERAARKGMGFSAFGRMGALFATNGRGQHRRSAALQPAR